MTLNVAVQMDHISNITIAGDSTFALMLEAERRGHTLLPLHARPARHARRARRGARRAGEGARPEGRPFHARVPGARRPLRLRRGAPPPGPALRHGLHHHDASPRAHPPRHAGRQRPGACQERAGKALRHGVPRPDAADADRARPDGDPRASGRSTATSSSSRSTAMAAPACSASPRATRTSRALLEIFATAFREPHVVQRYLPEVRKGDKRIILIDGDRRPAPSTACRRRARRAPTCMSAAAPSRRR